MADRRATQTNKYKYIGDIVETSAALGGTKMLHKMGTKAFLKSLDRAYHRYVRYQILAFLAEHRGQSFSAAEIFQAVGTNSAASVYVHICVLRKEGAPIMPNGGHFGKRRYYLACDNKAHLPQYPILKDAA
jgi:hypothetical protein